MFGYLSDAFSSAVFSHFRDEYLKDRCCLQHVQERVNQIKLNEQEADLSVERLMADMFLYMSTGSSSSTSHIPNRILVNSRVNTL